MTSFQTTNTILKKNITFETKDDDYRFVKSTQRIKQGEVILIEHCPSVDDLNMLPNIILNSPELFDNLYPRKISWNESFIQEATNEISELCDEKVKKNSFGFDGRFYIGLDISNFNHSNTPNASVNFIDITNITEDPAMRCALLYVYAHRDINIDEEITIWYSSGYIKEYFTDENIEEYIPTFKLESNYINIIGMQYMEKEICKNIMVKHLCMYEGLYIYHDMVCPTKRFGEYFVKNVKKECNIQNIQDWLKQLKYSIMYLKKESRLSK